MVTASLRLLEQLWYSSWYAASYAVFGKERGRKKERERERGMDGWMDGWMQACKLTSRRAVAVSCLKSARQQLISGVCFCLQLMRRDSTIT